MKEVILRRLAGTINHCFAKIILLGVYLCRIEVRLPHSENPNGLFPLKAPQKRLRMILFFLNCQLNRHAPMVTSCYVIFCHQKGILMPFSFSYYLEIENINLKKIVDLYMIYLCLLNYGCSRGLTNNEFDSGFVSFSVITYLRYPNVHY